MDYAFAAGIRRMHHEYTRSMKEPMEAGKCRVLFVSEAVTLAHVARPLALAKALDRSRYDVALACDPRYNELLGAARRGRRPGRAGAGRRGGRARARGGRRY